VTTPAQNGPLSTIAFALSEVVRRDEAARLVSGHTDGVVDLLPDELIWPFSLASAVEAAVVAGDRIRRE
jgi:hypothetical protein